VKPKLTQIIPIQKQNNKTTMVKCKKENTELYKQNIELNK